MRTLSLSFLATILLTGELLLGAEAEKKPQAESKAPSKSFQKALAKKEIKPRTADPEALKVVQNYLKAIGGVEALRSIKDRYEKFQVSQFSTTGKNEGIFERYLKWPGMVREDWHINVKVGDQPLEVIQIYNGKKGEGWTKMMGFVSPLDTRMISTLTWDKYLDDFFMHWKEDGYCLKFRSDQGEADGEPCYVIDVYPPLSKDPWRYFFSKKTHLIVKKQWRTDTPQGPMRNELFFSEWRKVPNPKAPDKPILVPFKQEQYNEGNLNIRREFLEVRINSGLSDDLFKRPEGPIFKGRIEKGKEKPQKEEKQLPPWKRKKRILPKLKPVGKLKEKPPKKETSEKGKEGK